MQTKHLVHLLGLAVFAAPFLLPWFSLPQTQLLIATGFGFLLGILSGGLGMGGVWLMVPSLKFLFGIDIKVAIGTALTAQVLITLFGSYEHLQEKAVGRKLAIPLIVGGIIGTPVGVWLNTISPSALLNWAYFLLLTVIGIKMAVEMTKKDGDAAKTEGRDLSHDLFGSPIDALEEKAAHTVEKLGSLGEKARDHFSEHIDNDYHGTHFEVDTLSMVVAGIFFGIVNGLLGTSTTLMVPFLDILMHLDIHVATAVSLLNVTAISIPAAANHILIDNVNTSLAAFVAGSGILGALLGTRINEHLSQQKIQYVILLLLLVMAYYMLPVKPF